MNIKWSPQAVDALNLNIRRPGQLERQEKLEDGYELPSPTAPAPLLANDDEVDQ